MEEKYYPGKKMQVEGVKQKTQFILTEGDIEKIYNESRSLLDAADKIGVSVRVLQKYTNVYKKDGKTYTQLFRERGVVPVQRKLPSVRKKHLEDILRGSKENTISNPIKFKYLLLKHLLITEVCACCGFNDRRASDLDSPLHLIYKDGNKDNGHIDNIQLVCYNCLYTRYTQSSKEYLKTLKGIEQSEEIKTTIDQKQKINISKKVEYIPMTDEEYISDEQLFEKMKDFF